MPVPDKIFSFGVIPHGIFDKTRYTRPRVKARMIADRVILAC
jgi:hypothetical protein